MVFHSEVLQIGFRVVLVHRNLPLVLRFALEMSLRGSPQGCWPPQDSYAPH